MEPYPDLHQPFSSFSPSLFSLLCLQETLHPDKILQKDIFFGASPWDTVTSFPDFLIFHGGECCLRSYLSKEQSFLCAALFNRHSMNIILGAKSGLTHLRYHRPTREKVAKSETWSTEKLNIQGRSQCSRISFLKKKIYSFSFNLCLLIPLYVYICYTDFFKG